MQNSDSTGDPSTTAEVRLMRYVYAGGKAGTAHPNGQAQQDH